MPKYIESILNQGISSNKLCINIRYSRSNMDICSYLSKIGLINGYKYNIRRNGVSRIAIYFANRYENKVIKSVKKVSTSGRRVFSNYANLRKMRKGNMLILSTSKGILSDTEALIYRVGGEILFIIRY